VLGGAVAVVAGLAMVVAPLAVPPYLGTIAVVLLGTMLIAGFAALAVAFAETTRPPKIIAAFGLKRFPVFIFMLVWVSLAGIATIGESNDVPIIPSARATPPNGVTVDDVFDRWVARNATQTSTGQVLPFVLVASSGGGVRAAAWSSYVLDCLFVGTLHIDACRPSPGGPGQVAAMSGVSGGSLGLAAWAASVVDPEGTSDADDWVKDRLGDDYLSSAMAWMLLVDTPRSFVGFGPDIRDRAEVMELSWERSWAQDGTSLLSEGMFEVWDRYPLLPLMVFNGTSVNDPCRFNASVLSATAHTRGDTCTSLSIFEEDAARAGTLAATKDLADFLCPDQDIKTSTAVLMSARFPVITPSARIGGNLAECGEALVDAYVVDGGYSEGSGAGTITEMYQRLERDIDAFNATNDACIVPFLIQIDNGYENPGAAPVGTAPVELLVPFRTLLASQFGRIANAREQAAIEFDRPLEIAGAPVTVRSAFGTEITSRYARITTKAHPGVQAPLGWTLSNASFDDLKSQLTIDDNLRELREIQRWLNQELTCKKS
jgi:Patatin-like phospholipase